MSVDYVFVDTGAFIALSATKDIHHKRAAQIYTDLLNHHVTLITTNHVINETCNWLLYDKTLGHSAAVNFGSMIRDVSTPFVLDIASKTKLPALTDIVLVYPSYDIEGYAWDIFCKYNTTGFSFTDCISFAVMQQLGIKKAFAFDHHFDILGFERL